MATANLSVPEEVKRRFNEAFAGRNKSAVIADLMERAVEEEQRRQLRREAGERLLQRRRERTLVPADRVDRVRDALRE
jgi:hypothetical protein